MSPQQREYRGYVRFVYTQSCGVASVCSHSNVYQVYHPAFTDDLGSMYLISRRLQRLSTGSILTTIYIVFILLIPVVEAADGEDFTNNLFSDLAPILTLLGEQVTKPFMSESSGWADSILLAMAPLGVITAIVSTIRVAGHPWLKALVGRGKEGLAQAELELMSSNSPDVGEMWNGQAIVRVLGKPSIFQFVYTPDTVAAAATTVSPTTSPQNNTQAQPQQHPADSSDSQVSYAARQGLVASVSPAVAVSPGMSTAQSDFVTKIDVLSGHDAFFERRGAKRSDERLSDEGHELQDNSDIEMHLFHPIHPTLPIRWCSVNRTSQAMDITCWGNPIHGWDETDE